MAIYCGTGHRPNKLKGYDLSNPWYAELKSRIKKALIEGNCTEVWCGMALGFDTVLGLAVIELKEEGYNIKLNCAIPCKNYTCKWRNPLDVKRFHFILSKADEVVYVHEDGYEPWYPDDRNKFMVDRINRVLTYWDGSKGGTGNCIKYAMKKEKMIINLCVNGGLE